MNSKKPIIELKNVKKSYFIGGNESEILKGINLKVYRGEFVSIVGKSGSGKTTLVNQIGCLDVPSSGEVYWLRQEERRSVMFFRNLIL